MTTVEDLTLAVREVVARDPQAFAVLSRPTRTPEELEALRAAEAEASRQWLKLPAQVMEYRIHRHPSFEVDPNRPKTDGIFTVRRVKGDSWEVRIGDGTYVLTRPVLDPRRANYDTPLATAEGWGVSDDYPFGDLPAALEPFATWADSSSVPPGDRVFTLDEAFFVCGVSEVLG